MKEGKEAMCGSEECERVPWEQFVEERGNPYLSLRYRIHGNGGGG